MPPSSPPMRSSAITAAHTRKKLIAILIALTVIVSLWPNDAPSPPLGVAPAKGAAISVPNKLALSLAHVRLLALAHAEVAAALAAAPHDLLHAYRLGYSETVRWRDQGCRRHNCAQATYYNYAAGGTLAVVLNLDDGRVLDWWPDPHARPAASAAVTPRALSIAAQDPGVRALLGDISRLQPAMVPMSGWLRDDPCHQDWCVDLTFEAPDGSGRILHVFVNMDRGLVARTFYSRGRAPHSLQSAAAQSSEYDDGCHEQYNWSVCWEMTAHDGINFYDAAFEGQTIFSSIKISQVEAWYASWPGGYRDELGFDSSVLPYFGTAVSDLDNGFEVRQLYSEFTRWPNCVCCYRYEQVMRFFAGGAFESIFLAHGPGCDDPSVYRPFFRIDFDLAGARREPVWYWENGQWLEAGSELRLPLFRPLSPAGERLSVAGGRLHYRWLPVPTDPVGGDDGLLFLLREKEGEGDIPIEPGAADTFWPPGQWLDHDALSGEPAVVWYIPYLRTRRGDPWWCLPDPDPEFSPCDAVVRFEPAAEPQLGTPAPTSVATTSPAAPSPAATPAATFTPRPIKSDTIEELVANAGCAACHSIGSLGEAGKVGPDLSAIGVLAATRVEGLSAADYLRQSILLPDAFIAPTCPNGPCLAGIMPSDYAGRLTAAQLDLLVAYLLDQVGQPPEPTPTLPAPLGAIATTTPVPEPNVSVTVSSGDHRLFAVAMMVVASIGLALMFVRRLRG